MNKAPMRLGTSLIFSVFALFACGGGGSDSSVPPRPAPAVPSAPAAPALTPLVDSTNLQIFGDAQTSAGASAGFAIIPKGNNRITSVNWSQSAGPDVSILAHNSQTIGFDVPAAGSYSFTATVNVNGTTENYTVNLSADAFDPTQGNIRLDHTVTELGKVSLHVGAPTNKQVTSVNWSQISGPRPQNLNVDDEFLFFDAPSVSQDSVIAYRAQISYSDGSSAIDEVFVTVKNVAFNTNGLFYSNGDYISEDMHAYRANSPYKQSLETCVYNNNIPGTPSCTLNDLPLIGSVSPNPSIEDILNRTLVSHAWMGDRFAEYLANSAAGPDMLNLLRGVTAIVISYDVRPSFYWVATGAIYLDANSFWRLPAERDTLNDQADFRSNFGSELQFRFFWRYVKDNQSYPAARYAKDDRTERSFADLEASLSWLMYHELAHANDFFPPTIWASINRNQTPLNYFNNNGTSSDILSDRFPLRSDELHQLAEVRFRNTDPTDTQKAYRGSDVQGFFTPDISPSFYSYLTDREDFATLVERFMMLHRLGADSDIAIIDGETNNDFIVTWGQRNRIASNALQDRTVFAVARVYPELGDIDTLAQSLPEPLLMDTTRGWFGNLVLPASASTNNLIVDAYLQEMSKQALQELAAEYDFYHHIGRPHIP